MKCFIFVVSLLIINPILAQDFNHDVVLLKASLAGDRCHDQQCRYDHESNHELKSEIKVRYNPIIILLSGSMWVYRSFASSQLASNCIYTPSCSGFGKLALGKFNTIKAVLLTADRLMRCHRGYFDETEPSLINTISNKIIDYPSVYEFKTN